MGIFDFPKVIIMTLSEFWVDDKFVIPWGRIGSLDGQTLLGLAIAADLFIPIKTQNWPRTPDVISSSAGTMCLVYIICNMRPTSARKITGNFNHIAKACIDNDTYPPVICHMISLYNNHSQECSCQFCVNKSKALSPEDKKALLEVFRKIFRKCDGCVKKMEQNMVHII